ncbi:MAG: manganese efflux pump [Candidatus Hydrogenedentes bacterium]|nr:manganese efflux pump [Candidatus Hydrogenedentota bacterium]
MNLVAIVGIAVGLAMDAFAVAVATSISLRGVSPRQVFRFAFHFGLFQAFMPVIGWAAGRTVADLIRDWDHWIAFGLLAFVGVKAIREALRDTGEGEAARSDPTRGWSLVAFSVATSIDALAVGLTFAMLDVRIWYPCVLIGLITAALTTVGMLFGARLGARLGRRVEVLGGLTLIGIGVKILVQHLFFGAGG